MDISISRPLAFFDLETTGLNITRDRIVEISILKLFPEGTSKVITQRLNPEIPISDEATAIHGIKGEDVTGMPKFKEMAADFNHFLENCDLSGYNLIKFDVPLLVEEFLRADIDFDVKARRIIDVQNIFHKMEPRTLRAAYRYYCNKEIENAHSAEADRQP